MITPVKKLSVITLTDNEPLILEEIGKLGVVQLRKLDEAEFIGFNNIVIEEIREYESLSERFKTLYNKFEVDKTCLRTIGLSGTLNGGAEGAVDVKDGRIVRIRPLHYDWKFDRAELNPWKFEKNGKTLEPNWKSLPGPYSRKISDAYTPPSTQALKRSPEAGSYSLAKASGYCCLHSSICAMLTLST